MQGTMAQSGGRRLMTGASRLRSLAVTVGLLLIAASAGAIEAGKSAPEVSGKDTTGKPVSLSALRGKVVIVDFMASWCGPCKESLPLLNKLYLRYRDHGLVVLGVSVDEKVENLDKFLKQIPIAFSVVHDSAHKAAGGYAPSRMPSSFVVDKQGTIRFVHGGFHAGDEKKLEDEVRQLLH